MLRHIFCGETVRGPTGLQTVHPPDRPQEPDVSNVTLTRNVLRWKLYLPDKDFYLCYVPGKEVQQGVPDALSRLYENDMDKEEHQQRTVTLLAL